MDPIYTPSTTNAAYQLNWTIAVFAREMLPQPSEWLIDLRDALEPDGIRILETHSDQQNVLQCFVSTRPTTTPSEIVRLVKGRLQYLLRSKVPKLWRRNYFIGSVGEANTDCLGNYVARQTQRHPMADPRMQQRLEALQFHDPSVDLSQWQHTSHGRYLTNLHIVLRNAEGWHEVRTGVLEKMRATVQAASKKHRWLLSRIGLVSDHLHILLGFQVTQSPEAIALSLMNNLAYAQQMKPVLEPSFYVGSFGAYDRDALRKKLRA